MSCSACTKTKPVPTCTQSLILGTVTPSTLLAIVIKSLSTGRRDGFEATSGVDGLIALPMSDQPDMWAIDQVFECQVIDTNIAVEPVTIGEEEYDCFQLTFIRINTSEGALSPDEITLEII